MTVLDARFCDSYCAHGGRCMHPPGHPAIILHDSGSCQWSDAQALTRVEADAVIAIAHGADALADLERVEAMLDAWTQLMRLRGAFSPWQEDE